MKSSIIILSTLMLLLGCKYEKISSSDTQKNNSTYLEGITCSKQRLTYENNIKIILDVNCIKCHGEEKAAHGVTLNNYQVVKKYIEKNELACVLVSDDCPSMPPKKQLKETEKNQILCWIKNGYPEK